MRKPTSSLTLAAALALLSFGMQARAVVWDSFQSYAANQVLATASVAQSTNASPWGRFGAAVNSNPTARAAYGPYDDTVARLTPYWAAGSDNATLVYCFTSPQNLSTNPGVSVKLMSPALPPLTNTLVYAEFQDTNANIWRTKTALAQPLSMASSWQTFVFEFNPWTMDEQVGSGAFDLSAVSQVRLRFYNPSGDGSLQDIYLDDFQSYAPLAPAFMWDNFQGYTNTQVLATNATILMGDGSSRWTRSGNPVSNPVARTNTGPNFGVACDLALTWSAGTSALLIYNFQSPTNLTSLAGVSVKLMTSYLPPTTNSWVWIEFQDNTGTIFRTKGQPLLVSNVWQTFNFKFIAAGMSLQGGSSSFSSALAAVTTIRLRFSNSNGGSTPQHIYVTDLGTPLPVNTQALTWDSFQAYTSGQTLASGINPSATSWGYFGAATTGPMVAKTGAGPNGETVGDYGMKFVSPNNNGNLVYYFPTPTNLTATPGFSVQLIPTYLTVPTNTWVYGLIEQTNTSTQTTTIWKTKAGYPLTSLSAWQNLVFNFTPATTTLSSGSEAFDLSSVRSLRVRFENASNDSTSQHVYLFDLESYLPKPVAPVVAVPQPVITQITPGAGNSLTIEFTSSDNAPASAFGLWTSAVLGSGANWLQDTGATISSIGSGVYQATTTQAGSAQFYRIRR